MKKIDFFQLFLRSKYLNQANMRVNMNYEYESEYESEPESEYESEPEYDDAPVTKRLSPLEILLEEKKKKEREQLIAKQKKEQEIKDREESAVVRPHLRWIDTPVQVQQSVSFADIENEQKHEREWTQIKDKTRRVAVPEESGNYKSEMCKSLSPDSKFKCTKGSKCVYAHSAKELKPSDCQFGSSCRFARIDYRKGTYINTDKTKRICTKKHPNESKPNFFSRTGIKDPLTVQEMESDWDTIEKFGHDFENNNGSEIIELKRRIENTPCNKTVTYPLNNPHTGNIINCNFTGELPAVQEKKQKFHKYKPRVDYVTQTKIKDERMNMIEKINKASKELASLEKTLKTNESVIARFSERTDSEVCLQKAASLKIENEQIKNRINGLNKRIAELKEPKKEEPKKEKQESCWALKSLIPEKPKEEVKPKSVFDLNIKSFRLAVSTEQFPTQNQEPTNVVPVVSKTKTQLCRSVGKYECKLGSDCKFAHNKDEWNVIKCPYGDRCFDVESIDGVYKNKENMKNRICQKQHNTETIGNVYLRVGMKEKPIHVSPIDSTWTLVQHKKPTPQKVSIEKTQICNSMTGNYSCRSGGNCKFAHSKKEWKILKCTYGERCFDAEHTGSGVYRNKKNNKNRVCQRQHEGESLKSVYDRLGLN